MIRRSAPRALIAGAIGLLLAGVAGAALSQAILPVYYEHSATGELTYSLMVIAESGQPWAPRPGLACGIGLGGWRDALRGFTSRRLRRPACGDHLTNSPAEFCFPWPSPTVRFRRAG